MNESIGIIGFGFVGKAVHNYFSTKLNLNVNIYDKYIEKYNDINNIINTSYCFVSVPTPYDDNIDNYNYSAIYDVFEQLENINYNGYVILKCTVQPEFTNKCINIYKSLKIVYNPEFLSAKTAFYDYENQKHLILGIDNEDYKLDILTFFQNHFKNTMISVCKIIEAESTKIFCNSFYASKIELFTEFYLLCNQNGANFNIIRDLMIKNQWINPMHTMVPGPDGNISFGGICLKKDIKGLNTYIKSKNGYNKVLTAVIEESNELR